MENVSKLGIIGNTTDRKKWREKKVARQSHSTAAGPTSKMVSSYIEM